MASFYTVEKSPSDDLSLRNCAVLRKGDTLAKPDRSGHYYIKVQDRFYLTLAEHPTFKQGYIGLSGVQREWCHVKLGQEVQVESLEIDRRNSLIQELTLEVDFYNKPKNVPPALDTDILAAKCRESLTNNVFVKNQRLVLGVLGGWTQLLHLKKNPLKAAVLKIKLASVSGGTTKDSSSDYGVLHENSLIIFEKKKDSSIQLVGKAVGDSTRTSIISPDWDFKQMGIGGLEKEFSNIFRRAFASRVFPPDVVEQLGMKHVRGILLYGPPGTGKTLMARQIGKMLHAREPKIVNGPEVLNKYVGETESNIRQLFAEAEAEQKKMGINSALHIIIFDELDAICKQRGTVSGGTGVHDTVVNQLLSKIDGVEQLNNILLIGMTNRRDLIDEALLRPGRLEVQMEISLPNEQGRLEILQIHTAEMKKNKKLDPKVNLEDLAERTRNFSGAEIEGLVRSAQTTAMNRLIKASEKVAVGRSDAENLVVTKDDFEHGLLHDIKPAFGISEEELDRYVFNDIIDWGNSVGEIEEIGRTAVKQIRDSVRTPLVSLLLRGDPGCGKTALAVSIARTSNFPFIKILTPENMIGFSEGSKCGAIKKVFDDAYKSELSCVVVDDLERLFDYVSIGPRFSNQVLQALLVLLRKLPPTTGTVQHKLLIIGTTSFSKRDLKDTGLAGAFNTIVDVPNLQKGPEVMKVLDSKLFEFDEKFKFDESQKKSLKKGLDPLSLNVGIKKLLAMIEASLQTPKPVETLLLRLKLDARLVATDSF